MSVTSARLVPWSEALASDRPLPAWPINVMLFGFPIYWTLGLTPFMPLVMGGVMALLLLQRRRIEILSGVLPWFAFALWIIPSALMLDSPLRLIGYLLRFGNILAVGIALLYLRNARERLPLNRVVAGLTVVWAFVVIGGWLGVLFPEVRLTTPTGIILPGALASNEYVNDLVNPRLAEVQSPWGAPEPFARPAAPFPYANGWGSAMVLFTPTAVAGLVLLRSRIAKVGISLMVVAALVPAVASLNRGMFLGLGVAIFYATLRLGLRGYVGAFIGAVVSVGAAIAAFTIADVSERIAGRQQYSDTTSGRAGIYQETWERTLESPLLGYGAPRPAYFGGISIGTQGYVWNLMFSFGLVGLSLFLLFLLGAIWRTRHAHGTAGIWLHSTLVATATIIFFYGLDTMQLLCVILCFGLLSRDMSRNGESNLPAQHNA